MTGCLVTMIYEHCDHRGGRQCTHQCAQPVTNIELDLCEQHEADRLRIIAFDLEKAALNA